MNRLSSELKDICCQLHDIGALKFGDFKMKVGINSPIYFDLRVVISYPQLMEKISHLIWKFSEDINVKPDTICGVPYTALPISTIVSIKSGTPMLIRRKEPKNYGTMKIIEGAYSVGDSCLIIEDVVTSGGSILETVKDLQHDGIIVKDAIVIVDREQGGIINLINNGITMHSLFTLSEWLEVLLAYGKIEKTMVDIVSEYIKANQIFPDGKLMPKELPRDRWTLTYSERALMAACPLSVRLFNLMEKKKSNLCIAIDVSSSKELLQLAQEVGEHAAVIKTHFDAVCDWSENVEDKLIALSHKMNFIILEDRKYSDIGNTVKLQLKRIEKWADAVTMHSIAGPAIFPISSKPVFLVAQLSSAGNLISPLYTQATMKFADNNPENIAGIVCQNGDLLKSPGLIQLTPGVATQKGGDGCDQQYATPEEAVLTKGGDLIVIGRAITRSSNAKITAQNFKEKLWLAYKMRIKNCSIDIK